MVVECVRVTAGARLHAGFHTIGEAGVDFAGAGFYASQPRLVLEATPASETIVEAGPLEEPVKNALEKLGARRVHVRVLEALPRHAGLGSTTQAMLAAAAAWYTLAHGTPPSREWLVETGLHRLGRQKGSTVGTLLFAYGGFTVGPGVPAPRGARGIHLDLPSEWRFVVAVPSLRRGMGEEGEDEILARVKPGLEARRRMERGLRLLLLGIARRSLDLALEGLREMQLGTGMAFSHLQGGGYRSDLQAIVAEAQRDGMILAQSSWGPTLYTITLDSWAESDAKTLRLIMGELGVPGRVYVAEPFNGGARIGEC